MVELLRTNDIVELSWVQAILRAAGIDCVLLDEHASNIEGSIGAIQRRLLVADQDHKRAEQILENARDQDRSK